MPFKTQIVNFLLAFKRPYSALNKSNSDLFTLLFSLMKKVTKKSRGFKSLYPQGYPHPKNPLAIPLGRTKIKMVTG